MASAAADDVTSDVVNTSQTPDVISQQDVDASQAGLDTSVANNVTLTTVRPRIGTVIRPMVLTAVPAKANSDNLSDTVASANVEDSVMTTTSIAEPTDQIMYTTVVPADDVYYATDDILAAETTDTDATAVVTPRPIMTTTALASPVPIAAVPTVATTAIPLATTAAVPVTTTVKPISTTAVTTAVPVTATATPTLATSGPIATTAMPDISTVTPVPTTTGITTVPVATTVAPISTTAVPVATTAVPVTTTAPIPSTIVVPVATTVSSVDATTGITAVPVITTATPISTTAVPVATTAVPVTTTAPIPTTIVVPVATTVSPVDTTTVPVTTTTTPTSTTPAIEDPPYPVIEDPPYPVIQFSQYTLCDQKNRPKMCTSIFMPVCAYVKNCQGSKCVKTVSSACRACSDKTVTAYASGTCEAQKSTCDPNNRPEMCMALYSPVCSFASHCQGPDCSTTAGNGCNACGNANVDYYIPGECPPSEDENKKAYCDYDNRPLVCGRKTTPVCGVKSGCVGNYCRKTYQNSCRACLHEEIDYYLAGECKHY